MAHLQLYNANDASSTSLLFIYFFFAQRVYKYIFLFVFFCDLFFFQLVYNCQVQSTLTTIERARWTIVVMILARARRTSQVQKISESGSFDGAACTASCILVSVLRLLTLLLLLFFSIVAWQINFFCKYFTV